MDTKWQLGCRKLFRLICLPYPNYVLTTGAIVAVIVLVGLYDNQRAPVADGSVGLVIGVPVTN